MEICCIPYENASHKGLRNLWNVCKLCVCTCISTNSKQQLDLQNDLHSGKAEGLNIIFDIGHPMVKHPRMDVTS